MTALLSYALTTLTRQKTFMGVTTGGDDDLITLLINQATDYIERYCGERRFVETTYTNELYDGSGINRLALRNWPVNSTSTFTLQVRQSSTNTNNWDDVQSDLYFVKYNQGIIVTAGWNFAELPQHYRVTYTAGYDYDNVTTFLSTVGAGDLETACQMLVRNIYKERQTSGNVKSEQIGNYSVTFDTAIEQDAQIKEILNTYTKSQIY